MTYLSIKQWAPGDRPREKLLTAGVQNLSDTELIAILIRSGTREMSAIDLSRQLLSESGNNLSDLGKRTIAELTKIKGIGKVKAIIIAAAFELGKRRSVSEQFSKPVIASSNDAFAYFHPVVTDLVHEEFWVLYLNRSNKIIDRYKLSQGGIAGTVIDIRLILKKAIELLASAIVVCHNHPSGNLKPSDSDNQITHKLKEASNNLDIRLLDHIIIADNSFYSYNDNGLI